MPEFDHVTKHLENLRKELLKDPTVIKFQQVTAAIAKLSAEDSVGGPAARKTEDSVESPSSKRRGYRRGANGKLSKAAIVAEAGKAQEGSFTITDLRDYLAKEMPESWEEMSNDDLSKQVYILRGRGQFTLESKPSKSGKGGKNIYIYNKDYPHKK